MHSLRKCATRTHPVSRPRNHRNLACVLFFPLIAAATAHTQVVTGKSSQYAIGANASFLPQTEMQGAVFKENGVANPGLEILPDHS